VVAPGEWDGMAWGQDALAAITVMISIMVASSLRLPKPVEALGFRKPTVREDDFQWTGLCRASPLHWSGG
jgi:hypothetical protein